MPLHLPVTGLHAGPDLFRHKRSRLTVCRLSCRSSPLLSVVGSSVCCRPLGLINACYAPGQSGVRPLSGQAACNHKIPGSVHSLPIPRIIVHTRRESSPWSGAAKQPGIVDYPFSSIGVGPHTAPWPLPLTVVRMCHPHRSLLDRRRLATVDLPSAIYKVRLLRLMWATIDCSTSGSIQVFGPSRTACNRFAAIPSPRRFRIRRQAARERRGLHVHRL
jgi:hypothetical protein